MKIKKKYDETLIETKFNQYILNKELNSNKRNNKSKSPLSIIDSPKDYFAKLTYKCKKSLDCNHDDDNQKIFIPIMVDDNDPFLFESKINIKENPFLSNLNKNLNFDTNYKTESNQTSFMKLRRKITINNNKSNLLEYNYEEKIDLNSNNTNLFSNSFLNSDILYNEAILNSISSNNFDKKNKDNENSENIKIINDKNQKIQKDKNEDTDSLRTKPLSEKENIVIE